MAAKYAQHFLINAHAAERIVDALQLTDKDTVLEIGPGKGALTTLLLAKAKKVVAIEVDAEMTETLRKKFSARANFEVLNIDILDFDLARLSGVEKIIGNLPYNLTSPILRKVCAWNSWNEAILMVQKEVGDRLVAKVNTPDYGALTVGMNLNCEMERVFDLSETSFKPPPRVKSTVVRLKRREHPLIDDIAQAQRVIQAAFQQRRKTILNSFSHGLNIDKETVQKKLAELNLSPTLRAENLSIEAYVHLATKLKVELT